jgi:DNA polymerase III delta prime subunit
LTEKYRPTCLDAIFGQADVVKILRKFAKSPHPTAFIFEGETGTGKTSAALALASALGCELSQKEFGGVLSIASGEQTADAVRDSYRQMYNIPWHGSGWKVVIANEADRMARPAETIWLDVLEAIPAKTVIIFTTNEADRLSQRFIDRCTRLTFESDAEKLRVSATALAAAVWKAETGKQPAPAQVHQIVRATEADGQLSFRRLMQHLTVALGLEDGHE